MSSRFGTLATALALCALGFSLPGQAQQTYKWTDAQGKVHYSDQPPPANVKQSATVKTRKPSGGSPPPTPEAAAAPKSAAEQEADFRQRKVEASEREAIQKQADAEAAQKKQNCEQSRLYLKKVQEGGRISRYNAQGEVEYLEDAQVAQEAVNARKTMESWCN